MKTYIVIDVSPPIPYLAKLWFSTYEPKSWLLANEIAGFFKIKCNISRKK